MVSVKNKVVWITGASSGIGEALTYELARKGAKLILSARRQDELERVRKACPLGAQEFIRILPLDLALADTLEQKTREAVGFFGHIDFMVHNGGISQRSLASETTIDVDRKIMEVNFFGAVAITKFLLPFMVDRKSGHFVVVSSMVGKFASPLRSGYSASKHALHGFFDALRAENSNDGIKVTMVCPGFIKTNVSINALVGSGEKQGTMDEAQANGIAPEVCAKKMRIAMEKEKAEIYVAGAREIFGLYVSRFFPALFRKLIGRMKVT
jgi:short-subunit dehydrogenase